MAELKPCKKCGSENWCVWTCYSPNYIAGYYVDCDDCLWKTDVYKTEAEAIEAWNRRAVDGK